MIFETVMAQRALVSAAKTSTRQRRELESQGRPGHPLLDADSRLAEARTPLLDQEIPARCGSDDELPPFPWEDWS